LRLTRKALLTASISLLTAAPLTAAFAYYNLGMFWRGTAANNPIQVVQVAPDPGGVWGTSQTITMPGNSTQGDLIVLTVSSYVSALSDLTGITATDSAGNSYSLAVQSCYPDGNYECVDLLYAQNIQASGSPITITVNLPGAVSNGNTDDIDLFAVEYSGIAAAGALDQTSTDSSGSVSLPVTVTSGSTGTTQSPYELLVGAMVSDSDATTMIPIATGTPLFTATLPYGYAWTSAADAIVSSTGTYQAQWTLQNSQGTGGEANGWGAVVAAFKGVQTSSGLTAASKIVLTSSAQSKITHQCSAAVNVVSETSGGTAANVTSDQSVALSGSGLQFYSDSGCTVPISSVTFTATASTTQTFYFAASTPGTITMSLTPSTFSALTQNETITLAQYTWIGGGGNANWSTGANWQGGSAPTTSGTAIFDGNCTSCNATISANLASSSNQPNIHMYSTYTGTITQSSGVTAYFYSMNVDGGTYNTGTGSLYVNYGFTQTGGTFNQNSATFIAWQYANMTITGGTFNGGTGTVQIGNNDSGTDGSHNVDVEGGTVSFNNLHLYNTYTGTYGGDTFNGSVIVTGNLTVDDATETSSSTTYGGINGGGIIYVAGNITANTGGGGYGNIELNGNNNSQTFTGASTGYLPNITIAHTGTGGVSLAGTIAVDGSWTYSSGTITPGTSTVQFGIGNAGDNSGNITGGSGLNFNNVTINNGGTDRDYFQGTITIEGNLLIVDGIMDGQGSPTTTVNLYGNLSMIGSSSQIGGYFSLNLNFVGTSAQTITNSGGTFLGNYYTIDKTSGSVTLDSAMYTTNYTDFTVQSGTLVLNGYQLNVNNDLTIDAGGTIQCNGGCGAGTACGQGTGNMTCYSFANNGGTVTP